MNFPHFLYGGDYNPDQWPEDIWLEDARRTNGKQTWLFALNHSNEEVNIPQNQPGYEILSGTNLDTNLHLAPTEVAIIRLSASSDGK